MAPGGGRQAFQREAAIIEDAKSGDRVAWATIQGDTTGRMVKRQTTPTRIKGHKVAASEDNPQLIVESDKTGARAAHKPGALKKR